MSAYALAGGFDSTPTPDSHIGPKTGSGMELSVFCIIYGMTALISLVSTLITSNKLGELNRKKMINVSKK
jgi:hypothetical protein